jgi:FMN hydrolase / 5-amino-6-(5-phospho-D-ribitylamino)uracil phosphatase
MTLSISQNSQFTIHNSPVSALLFDFGGTLDADGVPWKDRFFRLWKAEGEDVAPERFDRAFYTADDALVGTVPETLPLDATVEDLARRVARELGSGEASLPGRVASRFCRDARESLARGAELLGRLKSRYRLAVVSNFYGNLAAVCRDAGIERHLSAAVDSARVGSCKPDPAIFHAALARLGAEPAEAVFIGDSPARDMAGARSAGMRHVLLAGESSNGPRTCCPGDSSIRRLSDLSEMFL